MLNEEQQAVGQGPGDPGAGGRALQLKSGALSQGAEVDDGEFHTRVWGMGHGAWGMGHGAWGMGHGGKGPMVPPMPRTPCPVPYACIIFPNESSAASATASAIVGWAWIARSISSTVYSFSRATAIS